jgi:hypothetical protein
MSELDSVVPSRCGPLLWRREKRRKRGAAVAMVVAEGEGGVEPRVLTVESGGHLLILGWDHYI